MQPIRALIAVVLSFTSSPRRTGRRRQTGRDSIASALLAAAVIALGLGPIGAYAQNFPTKPIKVIVPFTPGSPVDVLARVVMQHLGARLNQTIVLDNRPGAGTTIGTKAAAIAEPDGHTLLVAATSFVIAASLYPNLDYDPIKSFAPVAMLAISPQVLVIAPSVPAKTLPEFIAYAKANPGKLNFGFGLATLPQILGESFKVMTGTDIASIPYRGGAQAITDMLGGRIDMNFGTQATLLPLIRQGKIRALAVTTETRARDLPDVPTMQESGLPQLTLGFSAGILAPAGTPATVVQKLNAEINEALKSPELGESLAKLGFEPQIWTPSQYGEYLAEEMRRWPPIVKAAGVKPE
jgi:tripartite-type tricarboxylate transporter receptor subunit TctC